MLVILHRRSFINTYSLLNAQTTQNQPHRHFLPDIMRLPGFPHTTYNGPDLAEGEEPTEEVLTPLMLMDNLRLLIPNTYDYFGERDTNVHEALTIRLVVLVRVGMRSKGPVKQPQKDHGMVTGSLS